MEVIPDNHRKKWTECENRKLANEIKNKTPFYIIANNHKRTIGAIKYKLIRNAIAEIKATSDLFNHENINISADYLTEITNLSKEELLEGFKKLKFALAVLWVDNRQLNGAFLIQIFLNN